MIDLHCHILPCLDDGAKDYDMSLSMARLCVNEGVSTIIATPHYMTEVFSINKAKVIQCIKDLQARLDDEKLPLKILPGMEVHLSLDVSQRLASGEALTLNDTGKYVLLELPLSSVTSYTNRLFLKLC